LPIGNYTSPWFSNFLLQPLDHFISSIDSVSHHVRYVDDIVVFSSNKRKLRRARILIDKELKKLNLSIKNNWQIFKTSSRPIDFLGVKIYPTHTTLRAKTAIRIKRRIRRIAKRGYMFLKDAYAIISYWGWIKRTNSYKFYMNNVYRFVKIKDAKQMVSKHAREVTA
jgi:hypothetical protein